MNAPLSVTEIRRTEAFEALQSDWWELWRRCPTATPFQSPAWLLSWWRAFAPGELLALAVRRGPELVGLAPFYLESGALGRRILPVGISVSDYLDVLVYPDVAEIACGLISSHLEQRQDWDEWELTDLPPEAQAAQLSAPENCDETNSPSNACPVLVLPERAQALRGTFPPRKRRALSMAKNRAARRGPTEVITADASSAALVFSELVKLHGARWESRGERGMLGDQRVRDFHREAMPRLLEAGLARLYALHIGKAIAGVYYGFHHGHRAYGYLSGFDPAYEFESPGVILLGHAIEQAVREGAREFHFLRGREAYKYRWGAVDRFNRLRVFRRNKADVYAA